MKLLSELHVVQFSFWDFETFNFSKGGTGFAGANGAGKTSLLDAIQIALMGAHGRFMNFNAQSVQKDHRSLRDYALGAIRSDDDDKKVVARKRETALSYITMVFRNEEDPAQVCSAGLCIYSNSKESGHEVQGMYVLPGVALKLDDHLDRVAGDDLPADWKMFEAGIRAKAKQAGMTPTITAKPETYVREMLHALQPSGQHMDHMRFIRNFKQSLNLKQVDSVNDFLRQYLVPSESIEKQGTLRHVRVLQDLLDQIERCEKQIVQLRDIDKQFVRIERSHRLKVVAQAVRLELGIESNSAQKSLLADEIEEMQNTLVNDAQSRENLIQRQATLSEQRDEIIASISRDPASHAPEQARREKDGLAKILAGAQRSMDAARITLEAALESASRLVDKIPGEVNRFKPNLALIEQCKAQGEFLKVGEWSSAISELTDFQQVLQDLKAKASSTVEDCRKRQESAQAKRSAARSGHRVLESNVANVMMALNQAGIECKTVASVIRIKDVAWQPAIETLLAHNRYALLVDESQEEEAVKVLRSTDEYDVTVVQSKHLRNHIGRSPEPGTVASIIETDDPLARAFVLHHTGQFKCVSTEHELRENRFAITRDGMVSRGAGTSRRRLTDRSRWVIGVQNTASDLRDIEREIGDLGAELDNAKKMQHAIESAHYDVLKATKEYTIDIYERLLTDHKVALSNHEACELVDEANMPEHLQQMHARRKEIDEELEKIASNLDGINGRKGSLSAKIEDKLARREQVEAFIKRQSAEHDEIVKSPFFDAEESSDLYTKVAENPLTALQDLEEKSRQATRDLERWTPAALASFVEYLNQNAETHSEGRNDWQVAAAFVKQQLNLLESSKLVDYKEEAQKARKAAEEAFRSDVKYKLRENFRKVKQEIADLNRILAQCPEFTGGERYSFSSKPAPQHKALYDFVESHDDEGSLFNNEVVQGSLIALLEACETGEKKGDNPLEDYRLFFTFDLDISVGGELVDRLSKRVGVGSNGEHRVPFYVIAAAALANAYRIQPGKPHGGFGLILMDEAFHGVDAQNTYSIANFIRTLGLQLIMAYPDNDIPKLASVVDNYYEITRFGPDVFFNQVSIKELGKEMMLSDIPQQNPGLNDRVAEALVNNQNPHTLELF